MRIAHINHEQFTLKQPHELGSREYSMGWDTPTYEEPEPYAAPTEGLPFDPGPWVEQAREAGATDLMAAFARCTMAWPFSEELIHFVAPAEWNPRLPVIEAILLSHPTLGQVLAQVQQDPSVPEGLRIAGVMPMVLEVGRVLGPLCRCAKG